MPSEITKGIEKLLDIKQKIDTGNTNYGLNMISYDQWLVSAVSLLLQIELMEQKEKDGEVQRSRQK